MANLVKTKFAGLLRGLLHRLDDRPAADAPRPVAAAAPPPAPAPVAPKLPGAPVASPAPPRPPANPDELELPLASVLAVLPVDLRAKQMTVPPAGLTIRLPLESVVSQLAFGAVKISFGELRELAPGVFADSGGDENRPISLPLAEILSRLNPALLARRSAQKVEVAQEIAGPFDGRGRGFEFTTKPLKAPVAPKPAPEPDSIRHTSAPRPAAPDRMTLPPVAPLTPPRQPAAPLPPLADASRLPPLKLAPQFKPSGNGNGNGHPNGNGSDLARPTPPLSPGIKMSPPPVPPAHAPAAPAVPARQPEPAQATLLIALYDLADSWPESLKQEILRSPLANVNVSLPMSLIEPGLKRGCVKMTWKQLRLMARPSSAASPHDDLELVLPLKVLAPAFLAAQKKMLRPQSKASVSAEIPDLFFGFPQAAAPAVTEPLRLAEPKAAETNFYVWGDTGEVPQCVERELERPAVPQTDFSHRYAHPKEVVARAVLLPGVAGALVALPDGLRVASEVPAGANADTLAAFLPQIYERVNQSTRELRMGALNCVQFTVGDVAWLVFRVNSVYFAAFGRTGRGLPGPQLEALAAELDRKKNQ